MPRPPRLCSCGRVVAYGVRCECQREATRARNARHDLNRPSARERGYGSAWRTARAAFLQAHPLCSHPGCRARATVVHHSVPHRGDMTIFWDRTLWQPLCQPHHDRDAQRLERAERPGRTR